MFKSFPARLPSTKTEVQARRLLYQVLETGARSVQENFDEPDDDWMPIWTVLSPNGSAVMITGDLHKHEMADRVGEIAKKASAVAVGFITSAWALDLGAADGDPKRLHEMVYAMKLAGKNIEDMDERIEQVMISTYSAMGTDIYTARIRRFESKPPTLGRFEPYEGETVGGRMVEPIQRALVHEG